MESINIKKYCGAIACLVLIVTAIKKKKKKQQLKKKTREFWTRKWINRRAEGRGLLNMLQNELRVEDSNAYTNFLRVDHSQFEFLFRSVEPLLMKQDTVMRECISVKNKLEITLRFLATGETFRSLMYSTRVHESTISRFIPEVCSAMCNVLTEKYLKTPNTVEEWLQISKDFDEKWQFPHCLGALDGRHIEFRAPISAGSFYYNYKGTNSIVLLGLVDAFYRFIYINVGVNGRISDGGVYAQSNLSSAIIKNTLNFPSAQQLPGQNKYTPFVIVADDAFPLSTHVMKPYPERGLSHESRIFNYRLSRARRIVENAFGILANRFQVLLNPIRLSANKTEQITKTCVVLHNFLATENSKTYMETNSVSVHHTQKLGRQSGNRTTNISREVRDNFKEFFNSPQGQVPWQENSVQSLNY